MAAIAAYLRPDAMPATSIGNTFAAGCGMCDARRAMLCAKSLKHFAPIKLSLSKADSLPSTLNALLGVDRERDATVGGGGLYKEEDFEERRTFAIRSRDCLSSLTSLAGERPPLIFNERERVCERKDIATSPA